MTAYPTAPFQAPGEIVANLLSNAIEYTPAGKRIWVRCYADGEGANLQLEDKGIGIPEEDLEKVFLGFYRSTNLSQWEQPRTTGTITF